MYDPAIKCQRKINETKRGAKSEVFGWDVFNQDSLYRAHFKKTKDLVTDKEIQRKEQTGEKDKDSPDE